MLISPNGDLLEQPIPSAGKASPDASAAIPASHTDWSHSYRLLGRTGLTVSEAGFGTYRVDRRVQTHRAALAKAIRMGINIIDTSSNYASGNSERLIGEVLSGMINPSKDSDSTPQPPPLRRGGGVRREEIVIVSKGGYIQGELYAEMERRANAAHADFSPGSELSELTRHSQGLWHSIHPDFLQDQIDNSLERLQLETIDIYLLHNPEYYVQWAIGEGIDPDEVQEEYVRRIKKAFVYLESEVERGRIQFYGISSNTFPKPEEAIDRTSVERAWQSAEEIVKELGIAEHHFAVIQFPLNIFEPGAVVEKNQRRSTETILEYCGEKNIGVLINRPLNAIVGNDAGKGSRLIRLADFPAPDVPPEEDLDDIVHDLKLQEEELVKRSLSALELDSESREAVEKFLTLGRNLDEGNWREFASVEEWREISQSILVPRIQYAFNILRPLSQDIPALFALLLTYAESVDEVFEHLSHFYSNRGHDRSAKIHRGLDAMSSAEYHPLSLSQKAVLLIRSLPQVSSVLIGMRSEEYVEDVVYGLQAIALPNAEEIWQRLAAVKSEG